MLAAASLRGAQEAALAAAREVWARYADSDGTIAPSQMASVLKDLDFNRRSITLGRGLAVRKVEVAALPSDAIFALRELGVDEVAERDGKRIPAAAFMPWYIAKATGDSGGRRNRLLVKAVTGRVKDTSYTLPAAEYVYGAKSKPDAATMKQLLAYKFSPDARAASPPPRAAVDAVLAGEAVKAAAAGGSGGPTYGAVSAKSDDIGGLLSHAHAPTRSGDEFAYPPHLPVRVTGYMPAPRDTVTSTLRAAKTAHGVAKREEAAVTGRPAGASQWKMARFADVPSRVPVDGKPAHFPRA